MAGRSNSKYTPERVKAIIQAIEVGAPYRHAAAVAGIDEDTFTNWKKRHSEFSDAVKEAEGKAVTGRLARIRMAEPDHWQAAAWWLERKYPNEFGKTVQENQVTGKDGEALKIVIERVTS